VAKKRRQKDEQRDDEEYQFPEFDEKEFIQEEMLTAKATFIAAGVSLLFVMISFFITEWNWRLAFAVGLGGIGAIFFVVRMFGIEFDDLPKKNWVGVGAVYFFTWLAVWIILSSPPITDNSEPLFWNAPEFYQANEGDGNNTTIEWTTVGANRLVSGDSYMTKMRVRVVDNQAVDEDSVIMDISGRSVPLTRIEVDEDDRDVVYYEMNISNEFGYINGTHSYTLRAMDIEGNRASYSGTFSYL